MGGSVDLRTRRPDFAPGADEPAVAAASPVAPRAAAAGGHARPLAYRIIAFGFPIWTFGDDLRGDLGAEAWGRYWGWDPKETWSFITWVDLRGVPARAGDRGLEGSPGRRSSRSWGSLSLLVTYYAVNLWIVGLHSYAK